MVDIPYTLQYMLRIFQSKQSSVGCLTEIVAMDSDEVTKKHSFTVCCVFLNTSLFGWGALSDSPERSLMDVKATMFVWNGTYSMRQPPLALAFKHVEHRSH